ncbi:hypothetical protein LINGRAHAP2_LOCUS4353, partial [Linum grandiflorum]
IISILSLIIPPKLVNVLPSQLLKEPITIPALHLLIELSHEPTPQPFAVIQKPGRNIVALVPPVSFPRSHPVARCEVSLQPHEIRYSFDQSTGGPAVPVPLPYMSHLVVHHPRKLPSQVPRVPVDVPGADVDFAV